jgi:predicted regulator of amino acid metabolism with ACT domain
MNKYYDDQTNNFPKVSDPLEAVHLIQKVLPSLQRISSAMYTLGLPVADDLDYICAEIEHLSKQAAKGICRKSSERLNDLQETNDKLMGVLLHNILEEGK